MDQTTIRIARRRTGMKPEILGEWYVRPEEYPDSPKMAYIRRMLADAQEVEPGLGWHLEYRGTERGWHAPEVRP